MSQQLSGQGFGPTYDDGYGRGAAGFGGVGGAPPPGSQYVAQAPYAPPQGLPATAASAAWQPGQGDKYQWDNMPTAPPIDDPNAAVPTYLPPPMTGMHTYSGYENVGGFGISAPMAPPPAPPQPVQAETPRMDFDDVASLKEEACREALLQFVGQHCCYGKGCAKDMIITKVSPSTALHYTLETFCEGRSTGYLHEPYRGGPVDGAMNGIPPPPWSISCIPDNNFLDHKKLIDVPHTATIQMCHVCYGRGFNRCYHCHGMGYVRCTSCGGDGRVSRHDAEGHHIRERCLHCDGDGRKRCHTCHGDGRITCAECNGFRQLRCYIQLTVSYINHLSDYILEKTDMPDKLVRNVQGIPIFSQELPQVLPIIAYPVWEINDNSVRLVEQHRTSFPSERQILQRQVLKAVPVTEVAYQWKDMNTRFWVYGTDRKVHAPDYPQKCCCGCQIL